MRTIFFLAIGSLIMISCKQKKDNETGGNISVVDPKKTIDPFLLTDSSWGGITGSTGIAGLKTLYGDARIKDERICGPECADSVDVTKVNPGDSLEFIVYWQDSAYHNKIGLIRCYSINAPYHTTNGIKMGTPLNELLRINGKPVNFSGFGWDYGGGIISLHGGALDKSSVRFNLNIADPVDDQSVYGDTELNTDMPAIKKLLDKIVVSEIFHSFN